MRIYFDSTRQSIVVGRVGMSFAPKSLSAQVFDGLVTIWQADGQTKVVADLPVGGVLDYSGAVVGDEAAVSAYLADHLTRDFDPGDLSAIFLSA